MQISLALSTLTALLLAVPLYAEPVSYSRPLLGVDTAGSEWLQKPGAALCSEPGVLEAVRSLGADMVVYHYIPVTGRGANGAALNAEKLNAIDQCMRKNGLVYNLNNEVANWWPEGDIEPGVNEFRQSDGAHRWDIRMEWLEELVGRAGDRPRALMGITYDEAEHMQLTLNQFVRTSGEETFQAPYLVDTDGMPLDQAYDRLVGRAAWIRTSHYRGEVRPVTEQVWPDMFHIFARAGWGITPKLLKENLVSVVMATAMGAALQYQSHGTSLWASPDLWGLGSYPGHSPEALRSALTMGYWLGCDALYVENLDWQKSEQRHPEAGPGSLVRLKEEGGFELTPYGQVVREFYQDYVPSNPRPLSWRDYRPRVAIVRLPDGAWGQRGTSFRDALLGNPSHRMDQTSSEWLEVWPLLTHGAARSGAISYNNAAVYPQFPGEFLVPIDSVAVFDHEVTGRVLDSVECFIVCGHKVSWETFRDIARRVAGGAVCIIPKRLYDRHSTRSLPGQWVVVENLKDEAVAKALQPFLGSPDVARFRFKDHTVEFGRGAKADSVTVDVIPARYKAAARVISPETEAEIDAAIAGRRPRVMLNPSNQYANRIVGEDGQELYNEGMNLWLVGLEIKRHLETDGRVDVFLTRKEQREQTTLRQEAALANEAKSDILVALHSDATGNNTPGGGTWTFYAGPERMRDQEMFELPYDLGDNRRLARLVQQHAVDAIHETYPESENRGIREHWYRLYMLHAPKCPSALIEVLFHTNPKEREMLKDPAFHRRIGEAIGDAILQFLYGPY